MTRAHDNNQSIIREAFEREPTTRSDDGAADGSLSILHDNQSYISMTWNKNENAYDTKGFPLLLYQRAED